ncbi:DMT family transporter [Miltoncostaea oceani]|uniref:DMT family transporter n=1 Tax=Miltoncostaea oceani TaxID=2843216 RepID=UPI001C3C8715|nr:DMT family transporter [Miltoncostaea oceani]
MLALALGLVSSVSWGIADFLGGVASRRAAALTVVALSQGVGLLLALVVVAATRTGPPPAEDMLLGVAAGISGVIGLVAFYRGMAVGSISIIAPISALGALVPLAVDLVAGRTPGTLALVGMVVALAGASLAARAPGPASRRGIGLALVAAVGFGGFFALLGEAASESALWGLTAARLGSVPLALAAILVVGPGVALAGRTIAMVCAAGVLDASANMLFALGSQRGLVSVVAVVGSLYPVMTVVLAGSLLDERLSRLQAAGAVLALGGVVLIAAG